MATETSALLGNGSSADHLKRLKDYQWCVGTTGRRSARYPLK